MQAWEAAQTVLAKLRSEDVELDCLIHCGYVAEGYVLSQFFPHNVPMVGTTPEILEKTQKAFEEIVKESGEVNAPAFATGAAPWWKFVWEIVKKLVDSWLV